MSPAQIDGYRTAADHLDCLGDWYLTQIDALGLAVAIPIQLGLLTVTWGVIAAVWRLAARCRRWCTIRAGRRGLPHLESYANNKHTRDLLDEINQPRKETP